VTATDPKLVFRAVGWQVVFSLLLAILVVWLGPRLLQLRGEVEDAATTSLVGAIGAGGWWHGSPAGGLSDATATC